jgi:hypothetical protein
MIVWILLHLSFVSALPVPLDLTTDNPPLALPHGASLFGTRSIWGIIWSCLSTIFACTWIAVHPNIPGPHESEWAVLRRRVEIMGTALFSSSVGRQDSIGQQSTLRSNIKNVNGQFIMGSLSAWVGLLSMTKKERLFESWNQRSSRIYTGRKRLHGHLSLKRRLKIGARAITSRKALFLSN